MIRLFSWRCSSERLPYLALAVAAALVLLPAPPASGVLHRIGSPGAPATDPPLEARKVKLGTATRNALQVPADFAFELTAAEGCKRLIFSTGIAADPASQAEIEFAIEVGRAGQWRRVYSGNVTASAPGWRDETVVLETPAAAGDSLRFSTSRSGAAGAVAQPYWGSVLILPVDAPPSGEEPTSAVRRPNVIVVSLDTLGADQVGWYGRQPSVSPVLDAFLSRSFAFRRAYSQYPNTLVSHASLFSGLYPNRHHVYGNATTLRSETLAAILAAQGYMTVGITEDAYVSSDFGFDRGFDWYDDGHHVSEEFPGSARQTFDKTDAWLRRFGSAAPFFLFVHTYEVHTPYVPHGEAALATLEKLSPRYSGPFEGVYPGGELEVKHNRGLEPIGAADVERMLALHAAEIRYLDGIFGEFLETLAGQPFAADTLVVVVADHGDEFAQHGKIGHGETLYNPVLHVPLAFYWPGRLTAGVEETRVQLIDVAPTILDLVDIAPPSLDPAFDGRSLAPVILGRDGGEVARPVFAELRSAWASCRELDLGDDCRSEHYAAQDGRFKYLTSMIPWTEALYDLESDPGETRNVAAEHPEVVARFRRLMADYVIGAAPEPDALEAAVTDQSGGGAAATGIDEVTRQRLEALGYKP